MSSSNVKSSNSADNALHCCSHLKFYQTFIFLVPIFFAFILLFWFYLFYLRPQRVHWSSMRLTTTDSRDISTCELGLKKELREMLPIIIFKESFTVKDTQCSVCLGDYQAEDRLQQIPGCGHMFHMYCIDLWLVTHTSCPLCRKSLLESSSTIHIEETNDRPSSDAPSNSNDFLFTIQESQTTIQQPPRETDDGQITPIVSNRDKNPHECI